MDNEKQPTLGNGKICYLEIPALDINRSSLFYQTVFSWNLRKRGDAHIGFDDGSARSAALGSPVGNQ